MNEASINLAFKAKLREVLGVDARIVFENTTALNTARPYYKATWLPAETANPTFGTFRRAVGIYQISIVVDAGSGDGVISTYVDALISAFYRGLTLSHSGVIITVEKAWRSSALPGVDSYTIPVSVRYWSDLT